MEKQGRNQYYLHAGGVFASNAPSEVLTVLGSCVAVCLWDKKINIGGINHFMLPLWNGKGLASPKYGNIAIVRLIEKMYELGSTQKNIVAKVFGGASVIGKRNETFSVGENNILITKNILKKYTIPIIASKIGGLKGMKLKYITNTGEVFIRYVHSESQ